MRASAQGGDLSQCLDSGQWTGQCPAPGSGLHQGYGAASEEQKKGTMMAQGLGDNS